MELKTYFAQDASGNIMPGAAVTVYLANTLTLATGLEDENGSPLSNPFNADSDAKVAFYAPDGLYDISVVSGVRSVVIRAQFADINGADLLRSDLASTAPGKGAGLVGFIQSGTGAVARTSEDKMREAFSVKDFGSSFDSAFSAAVAELRTDGGGALSASPGGYTPTTTPELTGEFTNGALLDGHRAVITSDSTTKDALFIGNKVGSIAASYFNKFKVQDLVLKGAGKTGTSVGLKHQAAADIQFSNLRITDFAVGAYIYGGLTSDYTGITVVNSGVGVKAELFTDGPGGLNDFAPNANTFYGLRNFYNDVAVQYLYNPSGVVNWIGSNFEANNGAGNDTDGVKVIELDNAGHHNFIGTHHESNMGQYGIWFNGFDNTKTLLMLGAEVIDAVGTNLHMQRGRLTSVSSRITNTSSANDIYLNTGARATLIDTEASISGDLSAVAAIRDGRIGFGVQPTVGAPVIDMRSEPIAASSNVAASFRNDTVQIRFQNTAGTRVAYLQTSATGDHLLNNDNAAGGWSIRANNAARLYVGRSGGDSIEPGAATTNCGTATLPWNGVYAKTVRTMPTTVAALPTAASAGAGARAFVTDATATTFASTVAGGGANAVPVYSDGANWKIG